MTKEFFASGITEDKRKMDFPFFQCGYGKEKMQKCWQGSSIQKVRLYIQEAVSHKVVYHIKFLLPELDSGETPLLQELDSGEKPLLYCISSLFQLPKMYLLFSYIFAIKLMTIT